MSVVEKLSETTRSEKEKWRAAEVDEPEKEEGREGGRLVESGVGELGKME